MRNKNAKVSDPNKFICNAGSDIHILYEGKLLPSGEIKLVPTGKESISEKINSYSAYTDIRYIMSRLQQGDTSVIKSPDKAMYGDFTNTPKSLAEALQIMINAERKFDALPLDIRNKFNNSYLAWLQSSGTDVWYKNMGFVDEQSDVVEEVNDEVKE